MWGHLVGDAWRECGVTPWERSEWCGVTQWKSQGGECGVTQWERPGRECGVTHRERPGGECGVPSWGRPGGTCGVIQWEKGYKSARRLHVGWVASESAKLLIRWHYKSDPVGGNLSMSTCANKQGRLLANVYSCTVKGKPQRRIR